MRSHVPAALKILAVDTTSDRMNLAVGDAASARDRSVLARGKQDEKICAEVDRLLEKEGLGLRDLDALAAASGPGSFTGIRIGLTFVSVLAQSLAKPAVGVTLLEAEATRSWPHFKDTRVDGVGILIPASREELFFQVFVPGSRGMEPYQEPAWIAPDGWPKAFHDGAAGRRLALAGPAAQAGARRLKPGKEEIPVWQGPPLKASDLMGPAAAKLKLPLQPLSPLYLKPAYYERGPRK